MIKFNEVTWYSKFAAIVFFLGVFPLLTFYLGMQYGIVLELQKDAATVPTTLPPRPADATTTAAIMYELIPGSDPAFTYPQITNYADEVVMATVNQALTDAFGQTSCGEDGAGRDFEWNVVTTVDYAQQDIFSVNASGNYFCGGAYPTNNYTQTLTFDMKTGETITFPQLFESYETDQAQILETIYAAQIELAKMSEGVAEEGSCSLVNTLDTLMNYTHDFRLATATKAVIVQPQYPHVIEACAEPVTVPVEQLLPFAPQNSLLYRL